MTKYVAFMMTHYNAVHVQRQYIPGFIQAQLTYIINMSFKQGNVTVHIKAVCVTIEICIVGHIWFIFPNCHR